ITEEGKPFDGDDPVFSLGHRNVQGLAFDDNDQLWASEFGSQTWDELNRIRQGNNYGWPSVEGRGDQREFTNPAAVWGTDEASPSGLAFADGSLWMASLRGARLWEIPVNGTKVGTPRAHFTNEYGRLRAVVRAPDGNLWLATSNTDGRGEVREGDDRILVVRP
ncbi:PQQ-dependent sugar dehydrogenase, partial [bacterium]